MKLRPSSGSVVIFFSSTFRLTSPLAVCSSGAAARDFDGLRRLADLEFHIERGPVAQPQSDARLPVRAEARLLDRQHILAGGQSQDVIFAALV